MEGIAHWAPGVALRVAVGRNGNLVIIMLALGDADDRKVLRLTMVPGQARQVADQILQTAAEIEAGAPPPDGSELAVQ